MPHIDIFYMFWLDANIHQYIWFFCLIGILEFVNFDVKEIVTPSREEKKNYKN
jgi:hypothetical protein